MKKAESFWGKVFRLNPFRISLLIVVVLLFLYVEKEKGVIAKEANQPARFISLELIEAKAYDIRFQVCNWLFPPTASDQVVVAIVDERTTNLLGWPFPRNKWGEFIKAMREYGASVIAFDMVFESPGRYLGFQYLEDSIKKYEDLGFANLPPVGERREGVRESEVIGLSPEYRAKLEEFTKYLKAKELEADVDLAFAAELKKTPGVVLGWYGYGSLAEAESGQGREASGQLEMLLPARLTSIMWSGGAGIQSVFRRLWRITFMGVHTNVPVLSESCTHFGFFTASIDSIDGTIRRAPVISVYSTDRNAPTDDNTYFFPSLSLAAVSAFEGADPTLQIGPYGVESIILGDRKVPTDESGRLLINWMGPQQTFKYYSIYDILTDFQDQIVETDKDTGLPADKVDPHVVFKDKIVLVGSSSIGAHDMRIIPFGTCPGVEMHANVISNILKGDALVKPEWFRMFDMFFILAVGLLFGILLPRLSAVRGGIVTLALFLGYLGMNIYLFAFRHYSFTLIFPLAELLFIYLGVTVYRYATEEREKRFIKKAFAFYLSPTVIDQLMKDPSKLKLGGERKVLTAFFSDIQGFSTISEKMNATDLVTFLNEYLTEMCDIILKYDGTIDKFEGDAIIAFFGAPIDYPDHAVRACLCAVEIQERMNVLREKWRAEGRPEIFMRIGLNTGEMVVGNMGSADRMDYTMMGDSVNLAARLEGAGKQYKIYTMISEFTLAAAGETIEVRELDKIRVMGKAQPVRVFEMLGKKGAVAPERLAVMEAFKKGVELFQSRYWAEAAAQFDQVLEKYPKDGPSIIYSARCQEFSENPPPAGWDGVYEMKTK